MITSLRKLWLIAGLAVVLWAVSSVAMQARAQAGSLRGYRFTQVAKLGDAAPGGGHFAFDCEVTGLNQRGDRSFIAERDDAGEGVFAFRNGVLSTIARPGEPAPGGGTFGSVATGASINNSGAVAFAYLGDSGSPRGGRVFRFNKSTGTPSQIIVPDKTPAPGGGVFRGTSVRNAINNGGTIVFTGLIDTHSGRPDQTVGLGVFTINSQSVIANVASPGDHAPGSNTCDTDTGAPSTWSGTYPSTTGATSALAAMSWARSASGGGDVLCDESLYLRRADTGQIQSIAHQDCNAPGTQGKQYRIAFGAQLNQRGDLVFVGDLTPTGDPGSGDELTIFSRVQGVTAPVVLRDAAMPGGGHFNRTDIFQPAS